MHLQFLGANRQVTGSRYVLQAGGLTIMIDCGLFQERPHLGRNWEDSPIDPAAVDVLLLTHAHLDHCGLIPKFVREGFDREILTTLPTVALARIVLEDAARIQEEDAAYKKRRHEREGRRGRYPEVPLYTFDDAERCLPLFKAVRYNEAIALNDKVSVTFRDAGHILGSAIIEINVRSHQPNGEGYRILFSGDIGQWDSPLMHDPAMCDGADFIIMESTYGDRDHNSNANVDDRLSEIVNATVRRGGNIIIPTFAIDRAQDLIYHFSNLMRAKRIPEMPVFLDSPMAVDVTEVFKAHAGMLDAEFQHLMQKGENPFKLQRLRLVRSGQDSRAINKHKGPAIIMAGAGMCTGGRIKHHLRQNITRPESTIVFVGYQSEGTLGREIVSGADPVRIHGKFYEVKARIERIDGMSAHADRSGLLRWLKSMKSPPKQVFLTHGEQRAAESLAKTVENDLGWSATVPEYGQRFDLTRYSAV